MRKVAKGRKEGRREGGRRVEWQVLHFQTFRVQSTHVKSSVIKTMEKLVIIIKDIFQSFTRTT